MGSLCSKPSNHSGGHTVLSSGSVDHPAGSVAQPAPADHRAAAAQAAENRLKASQMRGTNANNPNRGKLAAQATKSSKIVPEPQQEERLVWD